MTDIVKEKIILLCKKGNMDIQHLKIIKNDEGYIASDKKMSLMFNKDGKPTSLLLNRTYANIGGTKLGKWMSLVCIGASVIISLFAIIAAILNKVIY